jgi:hypothetical protein
LSMWYAAVRMEAATAVRVEAHAHWTRVVSGRVRPSSCVWKRNDPSRDVPFKFAGKIETVTIDLKPQDKASADAADAARKIDAANCGEAGVNPIQQSVTKLVMRMASRHSLTD